MAILKKFFNFAVKMDDFVERDNFWDSLKFLLIFFVVYGHMIETYAPDGYFNRAMYNFIYIFHMPFFMFISGRFSQIRDRAKYKKTIVGFNLDLLKMEYRVCPTDDGVYIEVNDITEGWMPLFGANNRGDFVAMPTCWPYDLISNPTSDKCISSIYGL